MDNKTINFNILNYDVRIRYVY